MGLNERHYWTFIANPPVSGPDEGRDFCAGHGYGIDDRHGFDFEQEIARKCDGGHWVWSSGAVVGGYEISARLWCPKSLGLAEGIRDWKTLVAVVPMRQEVERS